MDYRTIVLKNQEGKNFYDGRKLPCVCSAQRLLEQARWGRWRKPPPAYGHLPGIQSTKMG